MKNEVRIIVAGLLLACNNLTYAQDTNKTTNSLYPGVSRDIPSTRVVIPYGLEVSYDKTVHIIFPSSISYVDLGNSSIMAAQAEETSNVLRVKSAVEEFDTETNMSVICKDGSFYSFNVKYSKEPEKLNIEMSNFLSSKSKNQPSNRADIYFNDLGNTSPVLVELIMKSVYHNSDRSIKHLGTSMFGIDFALKSIYTNNNMLYFRSSIRNKNSMDYNIDFIKFRIVDREVSSKTAHQEIELEPLRSYNEVKKVKGNSIETTVWAFNIFSLPNDKELEFVVYELNGGRNLSFRIRNEDLLRAKNIDDLKLDF